MKKIISYIAMSLNGKIAQSDGSVHWLESIPNPAKNDYGYGRFYDSIDTTIQGFSTYQQIIDWGIEFPYKGKNNYVLTRKQYVENTQDVTFIKTAHTNFIKQLKEEKGKDIWLIGGGQVNTLLLNDGLIDELRIFVMPIILTGGIQLFESMPNETFLELTDSVTYDTGVVALQYKVKYTSGKE